MSVHLVVFDVVVELNLEPAFIDLGRYNNEAEVNQKIRRSFVYFYLLSTKYVNKLFPILKLKTQAVLMILPYLFVCLINPF